MNFRTAALSSVLIGGLSLASFATGPSPVAAGTQTGLLPPGVELQIQPDRQPPYFTVLQSVYFQNYSLFPQGSQVIIGGSAVRPTPTPTPVPTPTPTPVPTIVPTTRPVGPTQPPCSGNKPGPVGGPKAQAIRRAAVAVPRGTYNPYPGIPKGTPLPRGTYNPYPGIPTTTPGPRGTYNPYPGIPTGTPVPRSTYNPYPGIPGGTPGPCRTPYNPYPGIPVGQTPAPGHTYNPYPGPMPTAAPGHTYNPYPGISFPPTGPPVTPRPIGTPGNAGGDFYPGSIMTVKTRCGDTVYMKVEARQGRNVFYMQTFWPQWVRIWC